MTRADALTALIFSPFIAGVLLLVTFAVAWTVRHERRLRANPYMDMVERARERGQSDA